MPIRLGNHPAHHQFRRGIGLNDLGELVVFEHAGQTIRGDQQHIALLQAAEVDVGHHVLVGPDAPGYHIAVRVRPGLVGGQQPGIDLLLNVAVVLGDLEELAVAKQIGSAVADLTDQIPLGPEYQHGGGGAHPPFVCLGDGPLEDGLVGGSDRVTDPFEGGRVAQASQRPQFLGDDLDRHFAGDFARRMTTHPVGDDEHATLEIHHEIVFVAAAHDANVGISRARDQHG